MQYLKRHTLLFVEALCLAVLFFFVFVLDAGFAVSLSWKFCLIVVGLALLLALPGFLSPQRKQTVWLFFCFSGSLLLLHFCAVSPVKPFIQFERDVVNGTTISQVQASFSQRFPKGGTYRQPEWSMGDGSPYTPYDNEPHLAGTPNQSICYVLDPTDAAYNAELLIVYFKDGKAVGTEYLGD